MKEQIHTIPISEAMENAGECPFCYIERRTEEHMMNFVLGHGASYMEADIRDMTDREGFCRAHFKKMFDFGNSLGNAWILKTLQRGHRKRDILGKKQNQTIVLWTGSTAGNPPALSAPVSATHFMPI